jgi:hypothetical protein
MDDKTTMGAPTRPLCLELEEVARDIVAVVNQATTLRGIPCYMLESILRDILVQVSAHANIEREKAREIYNKQLAEYASNEK